MHVLLENGKVATGWGSRGERVGVVCQGHVDLIGYSNDFGFLS